MSRVLLSVLLVGIAAAQTKPSLMSVPQIEDRNLYYAFFNYHQTLIDKLQASVNANPSIAAQLNQQMATLLNVNLGELSIVVGNTQQLTKEYAALASERQASSAAALGNGQPTAAQLNAELDLKQARITVEGVRSLFQNLSPASWNGLHAYITGAYKKTVYKP